MKIYSDGYETIAVDGSDVSIFKQEVVVIYGSSGNGKSTLFHLLAGIERVSV